MYHLVAKGRDISCTYENRPIFSGTFRKDIFPVDILAGIENTAIPSGVKGDLLENTTRILVLLEKGEEVERECRGNMLNVGADIEHF